MSSRTNQLALTGVTTIEDYSNWLYGLNIAGIVLTIIIMSVIIYLWYKSRGVSTVAVPVKQFVPGGTTVVTEISD